ncbi:PilZ domain-containing protein [Phreatobacter aquaticus]|uniref:PilZ domain-containing protein n=1 Tax=Phreatobacter aquaticus TaxID=2570229 RepID=A0A4D7QGQ8_9HYPH|nr:PilZ domain-containing protein [Phreatobacter aquaticus]QCK87030.1 PilZ domain-containing protein [Phreatobacter aquaticus]
MHRDNDPRSDIGDFVSVERRAEVRVIMSLPGTYSLASSRDEAGRRREFRCRVINMSSKAAMIACPVKGPVGDRAIVYVSAFGKLSGRIIRVLEGGFVMSLVMTDDARQRLFGQLAWMEDHKNHDTHDMRLHARVVPRDPFSMLTFADGGVLSCLIMDMSATGAAISADIVPEIGTLLIVGRLRARVCRHFPEGFAVEFLDTIEPASLERLLLQK